MKNKLIYLLFSVVILGLLCYTFSLKHDLKKQTDFIEAEYVLENGTYVNIYKDKEIKDLKKENKTLYDSLKKMGDIDNVQFVTQFKYVKKYITDTVYVDTTANVKEAKLFKYSQETDSMSYYLSLFQEKEPIWYVVDFKLSDKLTIVNRNENGVNQTTISTDNGATIDDVTVFNKSNKKFKDKFSFGPQIGLGYGLTNKKIDVYVGVGLTYKF